MAEWPGVPVVTIPDSGATWPDREEVGPLDLIGPTAENRQPVVLDTRTETLRGVVNTIVALANAIRNHFLDRDGDTAAIEGSEQGPVFMRGDMDMGNQRIVNLADGVDLFDAVTFGQVEAIDFAAQDTVEQVLQTRVVKIDGSATAIADLDAGENLIDPATPAPNRVTNAAQGALSGDSVRKQDLDASVATLNTELLKRVGTPPMLADLDFDGPLPTDPGFIPANLGDPTNAGEMVNKRYLDEQIALLVTQDVPVGSVLPFAGLQSEVPANFLICDGREVSRVTYVNLFNVIGIAYGTPSSSNVFRLPDLRGRVIAGLDNMGTFFAGRLTNPNAASLGGQLGEEKHELTVAEIPIHNHTLDDRTYAEGAGSAPGDANASDADNQLGTTPSSPVTTDPAGLSTPHDNVQPSMALNHIIRY